MAQAFVYGERLRGECGAHRRRLVQRHAQKIGEFLEFSGKILGFFWEDIILSQGYPRSSQLSPSFIFPAAIPPRLACALRRKPPKTSRTRQPLRPAGSRLCQPPKIIFNHKEHKESIGDNTFFLRLSPGSSTLPAEAAGYLGDFFLFFPASLFSCLFDVYIF